MRGGFEPVVARHDSSAFYPAFYSMSASCVTFYAVLAWCGVRFVRLRPGAAWPFTVLMIVEVVYFFSVAAFAMRVPDVGMSIAGALGVANGGLMAQFVILFPLWGPASAMWARRPVAA